MKWHFFIVAILTLSFTSSVMAQKESRSLDGQWTFKQVGQQNWMNAKVPGTVHTDLKNLGKIEDPYYRLNEHNQQWVDKVDWEYQKEIFLTEEELSKDHIELLFEGLDTYATVFWNEEEVLSSDNMFRRYHIDLSQKVKKENILRVVFTSPIRKGLSLLADHGYPLPAINDQSELGGLGEHAVSIFTRKAGYHYGWDWGPRFVTSGIWRSVNLISWNSNQLKEVFIKQEKITSKKAFLKAKISVENKQNLEAKVFVNNHLVSSQSISSTENEIDFEIENPNFWYPNGMGEAYLYNVRVEIWSELLLDTWQEQIGLRDIEWVLEKDKKGDGTSFYLKVNGQAVFSKGANYIPNDLFLPEVSEEKYEHIVLSAKKANMNMLRVWGGGIYENKTFYDLCDKHGIMVWQDFMFACSMYPGHHAFLENVRQEAIDNVKRLRNHPSIVLWCGNNEIEAAWSEWDENSGWGWKQKYNSQQRKEIWAAYDTIFHQILPQVVDQHTDNTFYWHSSPSAGFEKISNYESNSGDMHYWGVWHGEHPFEDFRKYIPRFMSEYGFQSFPSFNAVKRFTLPEDWDIESEVMASHQRSGIGNLRIRSYMEQYYQVPIDFEQLLYVGQVLQAKATEIAIEAHRNAMPYCMGTLYWQINDCWPVASWSSIDSYGNWKAMHYKVKQMYEPILWTSSQEGDILELALVNDLPNKDRGQWYIELMDFEGNSLWKKKGNSSIASISKEVIMKISLSEIKEEIPLEKAVLKLSYENEIHRAERTYFFVNPKNLILPKPDISFEVYHQSGDIFVELKADVIAKDVFLYSNSTEDAHFSENYFELLPNETKTVKYLGNQSLEELKNNLKLMHLQQTMKSENNSNSL
ncbi:beta-mannosidase [Sediminitomix flava]|uniref:Beta-mannosidase B n=1 Tax=Sediminitomix flava TaxID=379075 RepID=A0A315Z8W5_SEDFL|nr:glycoside hydrolase family 2 protein [Sediminitomix flava]PWJ41098.1 beta-mannosidase [Sediminitomix flava]